MRLCGTSLLRLPELLEYELTCFSEARDILFDRTIDMLKIETEVVVDENIAKPRERLPIDVWSQGLCPFAEALC